MDERTPRMKAQILDAAMRLMKERGYHRTALGDVLRESQAGKGIFYHYFESKEALGYAILDRLTGEFVTRTLDPIFRDPGRRPLEQVHGFLDALMSVQRARRCVGGCPLGNLAAELADSHEGFRERLTQSFDQWRACLADALCRAQADGTLSPAADPGRLARFLVAGVEGAILLTKVGKDITVLEDCIRELKEHLAGYIAPTPGGPAPPAPPAPPTLPTLEVPVVEAVP
jgi:TetR/AcrR family transcriptional repressor of nem operon